MDKVIRYDVRMASRVFAFHCGGVRSFRGFYDVTDERAIEVVYEPAYFFLLEFEDRHFLFDTGMNPRLKRDDDGGPSGDHPDGIVAQDGAASTRMRVLDSRRER